MVVPKAVFSYVHYADEEVAFLESSIGFTFYPPPAPYPSLKKRREYNEKNATSQYDTRAINATRHVLCAYRLRSLFVK